MNKVSYIWCLFGISFNMRGSALAKFLLFALLIGIPQVLFAQTTVTSGNWNDPTVWSGGAVPAAGGTVNVNNPLTIDGNLSPTGVWTFNSNATDQPGGTAYFFNPNTGTNALTISSGVTVTFEGGGATQTSNGVNCNGCNQFNSGTINISGTLILASTRLNNDANLNINILAGGTLIINGDLINKNNSGTFTITGALIVNGTFDCATGSVAVGGSGTIDTTGPILSNGGSTIFGTPNDCTAGPCSGTTLNCTFTNTVSPTSKVICSGSTSGALTVTTDGGTPTYQWESSTTSSSSGFANATGTSTSSTYTSAGLTVTTWYRVAITSGGCTSRSAAVKVTVLSGGGWIGTTNNWVTPSNWCSNSRPTNTTDVIINSFPSGSGLFMPVIASATNATTLSLTINTGASVTVNSGGTLSLSGDLTNNGTFTDNSSAANGVSFVGTVAQTIAGTTANVFKNLTIANTSGLTPAISITTNNVTVNSNLTMTSGLINLSGFTITLGTAAGSTGTLAYTVGARFYGGNIERWVPTTAITFGNVAGQFPIGTSTDYRPLYVGSTGLTGGSAAGGTIKVRHSTTSGSTAVSPTFVDNTGTVALRSNSFWTVTTANGIASTLTPFSIRTEGTGFGPVGALTDLRITLVNSISPGSDGSHTGGTLTNPEVNRTGLSTANLSNSFYWGSINATNTPLPIELLDFTVKLANSFIDLSWSTSSELNNDFFTVERASNLENFEDVTTVKGQGTINTKTTYTSIDDSPLQGTSYYRLKQTDFDGKFTYSEVRKIENSNIKTYFKIYPNPVVDSKFNFELTGIDAGIEVPIRIVNMQGVSVFEAKYTADKSGRIRTTVELNQISSGMYVVIVNAATGLRKKILIQ